MLGIEFPPELKVSLKRAEEDKRKRREKFKSKQKTQAIESDDYFAYIAGYTSGGAPYGITWEENAKINEDTSQREQKEDLHF